MSGILCAIAGATYSAAVVARTAKTVVAQGTAAVSTAQSQFGGASALVGSAGTHSNGIYVATNGDYFGTTSPTYDMANWNSYAGGFTCELWVRYTSLTEIDDSGLSTIGIQERGDWPSQWSFGSTRNGALSFEYNNGSMVALTSAASQITTNTWYHIAWVRNGTNIKIYLNGVEKGSATISGTVSVVARDLSIGSHYRVGSRSYVDEIRISKTARYTTGFTPTTSPFTNDADTLFLLHCNGTNATTTFVDDTGANDTNRTAHTLTRSNTGVTTSTAQSKFGGSSILFASGHYLTATNHNATEFEFTAGEDFTIEFWFRYTTANSFNGIVGLGTSRGASANNADIYIENSASTPSGPEIRFATNFGSPVGLNPGTSNTLTANTWYHYAVSRSGTTFTAFLNGVSVATTTATTTVGQQTTIKIGALADGTNGYTGYLDELRISNTARYTAGFTPSASAFTNDVNTLLLLHGDGTNGGSTFTDDNSHDLNFTSPTAAFSSDANTVVLYHLDNALTDSSSNAYTLNTSGGYSSSVVKFGTYSGNLSDSTSDYFAHTTDRYFAPYNGTIRTNLTWECWAYYTSWSGASFNHASQNNPHPTLMCAGDQAGNRQSLKFGFSGSEGPYASGLLCAVAGDNTNGNIDTFTIKGTTSFSLNTWYHVALTFNASTGAVKGYVDGVLQFSGTKTDLGYTLNTHLTLGAMQSNNSACYLDEVRISRTLRYGT